MQKDFFNSDSEILEQRRNPSFKMKLSKIARKITPFITGFIFKVGKSIYQTITFFIVLKIVCYFFNIHITIN